jgi:hypothetical protein
MPRSVMTKGVEMKMKCVLGLGEMAKEAVKAMTWFVKGDNIL